jgi:hypothetical protein
MGSVVQRVTLDAFLTATAKERESEEGSAAMSPAAGRPVRPHHHQSRHAPTLVLTGFPYDEGCRRNGGRVGAAKAPEVVRQFINKMGTVDNPETGIDLTKIQQYDVGDVAPGQCNHNRDNRGPLGFTLLVAEHY